MIKTTPRRKKCKKVKWLSDEVLQIAKERREKSHSGHRTGKQGRKRKLYSTECRGPPLFKVPGSGPSSSVMEELDRGLRPKCGQAEAIQRGAQGATRTTNRGELAPLCLQGQAEQRQSPGRELGREMAPGGSVTSGEHQGLASVSSSAQWGQPRDLRAGDVGHMGKAG